MYWHWESKVFNSVLIICKSSLYYIEIVVGCVIKNCRNLTHHPSSSGIIAGSVLIMITLLD